MILPLILGIAGFVLFFLYDINSITTNYRIPKTFFFTGSILIVSATVLCLIRAFRLKAFSEVSDIPLLLLGLLSFAALIHSLFFALPFEDTYVSQNNSRRVYDKGVYALCRHPGVLFFFASYLFIGLAALPSPLLVCGMVFSFLNFLYVCFQDLVTFPRTFIDYRDYKNNVPFMIPTLHSFRRMCETRRRINRKEDSK